MDRREAEKAVAKKCEKLLTKLDLYTADDIDRHYDEAEFKKEAYCEAEESISELLCDYCDSIPTQTKE